MNLCKKVLPYVLGSAIFLGNTSHAAEILLDSNTAETILSSDEQALKITLHDSLSKENIAADIAILAATGYAVFRSNSKNGTYTRICKVQNGSTLSANDTTVTAGKTYYYKVRAFRTVNNKSTFSQFSEIAQKTAK